MGRLTNQEHHALLVMIEEMERHGYREHEISAAVRRARPRRDDRPERGASGARPGPLRRLRLRLTRHDR
jgi:hypothetical protein